MNWQEACSHPNLKDLPFKIELNQQGQIIMSPMKLYHGRFQSEISKWISIILEPGKVVTECAIKTQDGTKVADVAWFSDLRWEQVKHDFEASVAPEICVEILSPSNTPKEMQHKKRLYFQAGAQEFWLCDEEGQMTFYNPQRKLKKSLIVPDFLPIVEV